MSNCLMSVAGHLGLRAALRAVGLEIPTCGWASSRPPAKGKQEHPRGMFLFLVPVAGLEPARCRQRWILSPLRLPIPSHRQKCALIVYNKIKKLASILFLIPKFNEKNKPAAMYNISVLSMKEAVFLIDPSKLIAH